MIQVKGIGPETERKIVDGLTRERPHRRRALLLNRARALAETIAGELSAEIAGEVRRWCDVVHELALVTSEPDAVERLEASPTVVTLVEREAHRAIGVTVEGIPVEVVVAAAERFGTELVRATGSPEYVASLGELPAARTEEEVYKAIRETGDIGEDLEKRLRGEIEKFKNGFNVQDAEGVLH